MYAPLSFNLDFFPPPKGLYKRFFFIFTTVSFIPHHPVQILQSMWTEFSIKMSIPVMLSFPIVLFFKLDLFFVIHCLKSMGCFGLLDLDSNRSGKLKIIV